MTSNPAGNGRWSTSHRAQSDVGYIEIVPIDDVVFIDWSVEQAMTFVMIGGTSSPDQVHFTDPPVPASPPSC